MVSRGIGVSGGHRLGDDKRDRDARGKKGRGG
jgi:hypothetical protein